MFNQQQKYTLFHIFSKNVQLTVRKIHLSGNSWSYSLKNIKNLSATSPHYIIYSDPAKMLNFLSPRLKKFFFNPCKDRCFAVTLRYNQFNSINFSIQLNNFNPFPNYYVVNLLIHREEVRDGSHGLMPCPICHVSLSDERSGYLLARRL